MSGPQRVTITYTAPPSFLSTDHWKQVNAALQAQLPLRNLHWKSAARPTIRTIQELHVNLVAVDALRDEHTSQVPQTILEKPLLNVYIVVCEDTELYKNSVKRQIKDWHNTAAQRKNQEWLIIHIVPPDSKSTSARLFQVKASVLDKIKADFNVDKKDRCVQLVWSPEYDNPTAWAELISKIKEGILSAFDAAISIREDEVRRSEGQRQMPGWNFCTYFILKESLASSFEGMNLHDEALLVYDELEVLFFQVMKDKNLSWFGTLASPARNDDSAPLLSVSRKPYRDLILANSISVMDFRVYLLARQCGILSSMGRIVEVGRKVATFLQTFGWRLREVQDQLPPHFIESWTYSSALSVVDQCNAWAKSAEMTKPIIAAFNAVRGELVELARHQLDILGIDFDFLPDEPPFSDALPKDRPKDTRTSSENLSSISKTDLRDALEDKEAFFEMYIAHTNRAIELYASAGRRKFALRMHGSLAALDVVRGRLSNAMQTYTSLPAHYSPHGWTSLEAFMLTRALDLHDSVAKPHDRDWLLVLLEYLKAYVQDLGKALLISKDDHVAYTSSLVQALREAASSVETDMTQPDHPAISFSIADADAKLTETRDGAVLTVNVKNHLPCDIPVDDISVVLQGREGNRLTFSERIEKLSPGNNTLTLFCPSATVGTYSWYSSQARIARLTLQWLRVPGSTKSQKAKLPPVLVRVPRDLRALDIKLRQPERVQLGAPPKMVLALCTGRNDVSKAMIRLAAPAGVQFYVDQAELETEDENITFETVDGSIILLDMHKDTAIRISVPHSDASAFHSMRVVITVDYVTTEEPTITRTVHLPRMIQTALPLAVNVEDFFRGTRLFTRFTLSTTSHQHIRIKGTELRSTNANDDGLKITKSIVQQSRVVTVTPEQPGRFLFQLDSKKGKERDPLHLHITYRMLREEVESFIEAAVDEALLAQPSTTVHRDFLVNAFVQALEQDASWVDLYGVTGELNVPGLPTDGEASQVLALAAEVLKRGRRPEENEEHWREIVIPLDVPQMHILAGARLRILPSPFSSSSPSPALPPLYAGQPISATLTIETSFHWAPAEDSDKKSYIMRFDVEEMTKDWLVSGLKRGDFVAKDGHSFEVPVTLIALHHGELPLPKVAVQALSVSGEGRGMRSVVAPSCETHQLHGAEKVLVLPRGGRTTFVISMGDYPDS
ncbi:trafficking protein particle complex subunit 10 [Phanerochaete sordida]|uniref:Trafficking protein particle complex subunit 10 n=1 Tax=Phanerochaete sordida TaxID=48140 RepID=A0A9P3GKG8_9APHY|nr:trafficking protein particle complex subunit 10 [Phanerochaete sordida]